MNWTIPSVTVLTLLLSACGSQVEDEVNQDRVIQLQSTPLKVMPIGDSITSGFIAERIPSAGYRRNLFYNLNRAQPYPFEEVGSLIGNKYGNVKLPNFKDIHDGHNGMQIDDLNVGLQDLRNILLTPLRVGFDTNVTNFNAESVNNIAPEYKLSACAKETKNRITCFKPDIILLMVGSNDMKDDSCDAAFSQLTDLISNIYSQYNIDSPPKVFLASIPRTWFSTLNTKISCYNNKLKSYATDPLNSGRGMVFVPVYDAISSSDLYEGIHPNKTGYCKMGKVWFDSINSALNLPRTTYSCPR